MNFKEYKKYIVEIIIAEDKLQWSSLIILGF